MAALFRGVLLRQSTAALKRFRASFCATAAQGDAVSATVQPPHIPQPEGELLPSDNTLQSQEEPLHSSNSDPQSPEHEGEATIYGYDPDPVCEQLDQTQNDYGAYGNSGGGYGGYGVHANAYGGYGNQPNDYSGYGDGGNAPTPLPPSPPPPPKIRYENSNVPISLVCLGRAMQLKFKNQKEFEQMLDKASSFGVMLPDEPGNLTRDLCDLDPKKVYVVVDMKAALKYTKRLAAEEAKREGYPKDFMKMMNRNKYGKYDSDDDDD